ncbi:MAG TPA: hypothetical protein VKC17_08685 [Sphingomicrobium sp.]|jgi:hypothetical protein|nr:hypothetical protein [Sphingomicrobium sp.]
MIKIWTGACVILLLSTVAVAQSPEEFAQADITIRRLAPSAMPGLSGPVRQALERRGCTIPQLSWNTNPHNAARGAFTAPNGVEWAVLCSRKRISSILVLAESSGAVRASLARRPDVMSLQRSGQNGIVFSREISTAAPDIVRLLRRRESNQGAPVTHDGIRDAFVDKYSTVWYRDGSVWRRIAGSD